MSGKLLMFAKLSLELYLFASRTVGISKKNPKKTTQ